ncbi:MAG: DUF2029 domain-containing protein [Acidobacteria bacterium]|nr:DUF2029 domain-containing protein [Acidobacteriota bacterium]
MTTKERQGGSLRGIIFWTRRLPRQNMTWGLAGASLVALHVVLALLSSEFAYERDLITQPILTLIGLLLLAGAIYLLVIGRIPETPHRQGLLIGVLVLGATLRVGLLFSTPMLEDDHYRYLWDGAVVTRGMNPYAFAPSQMAGGEGDIGSIPAPLRQLAADSGVIVSRINYPSLRTIYPPVAQAAFALAHWIQPWSLFAWRLVLLAFDVTTLGLLILILRALRLPLLWLTVYWWNPILTKETFNSAHMDVIVLPFVLGAVLLMLRDRHVWAAGALGLAMGAKIWPIVLLPILLRPILTNPKKLIPALALFGLLAGAMFLPVHAAGFDHRSGFVAYGESWEMNDALFMLILWGKQAFLQGMSIDPNHSQLFTRIIVAAIVVVWTAWLTRNQSDDPAGVWERCLLILAAVFLLSPTQFPWYYLWLLPFLVIRPRSSLLVLTALLPLYYLRFYFAARDRVEIFDYGIVWLEYIPVWYLLLRELYARRQRLTSLTEAVA